MICIGIDPSLTGTAVCIGNGLDYHEVTRFTSEAVGYKVAARTERYEDLVARVMMPIEAVAMVGNTIDAICIEGYAHNKNPRVTIELAEYGGILRFHLIAFCKNIWQPAPTTLKKFCSGRGDGKGKTAVIAALTHSYGVNFRTDDEYDAFGLYRMALCLAGAAEPKGRAQREAIDAVLGVAPTKQEQAQRRAEKRVERLLHEAPPNSTVCSGKLPF